MANKKGKPAGICNYHGEKVGKENKNFSTPVKRANFRTCSDVVPQPPDFQLEVPPVTNLLN